MSKEKIENIIKGWTKTQASYDEAADNIIEMLKEDYNFEFPIEFDYKKCSYNRGGSKILFAIKEKDGRIFYVCEVNNGNKQTVTVSGIDGSYWENKQDSDYDLIMDKQ